MSGHFMAFVELINCLESVLFDFEVGEVFGILKDSSPVSTTRLQTGHQMDFSAICPKSDAVLMIYYYLPSLLIFTHLYQDRLLNWPTFVFLRALSLSIAQGDLFVFGVSPCMTCLFVNRLEPVELMAMTSALSASRIAETTQVSPPSLLVIESNSICR